VSRPWPCCRKLSDRTGSGGEGSAVERPAWGEQLTERVTDFARLLRRAGLPAGPGDVLNAVDALSSVNVTRPDEFYWALHAVFVRRADHRTTFLEAFKLFWSDRPPSNAVLEELLSHSKVPVPTPTPLRRRLAEAWAEGGNGDGRERETVEVDLRMSYSEREALSEKDFEQMSVAEIEAAREAIVRMRLPVRDISTRRRRLHRRCTQVRLLGRHAL
jgi:uncharacterized protein with von Willebrand factor type A (vWA) domain